MEKKVEVLERALRDSAALYSSFNVTKDKVPGYICRFIEGKPYNLNEKIHFPNDASYTDLLHFWASRIPEEEKATFLDFFSPQHLRDAYEKGEYHLIHRFWIYPLVMKADRLWMEQHMVLFTDEVSGDLCGISYVIDLTPQYREMEYRRKLEQKQKELEKALEEKEKMSQWREWQTAMTAIHDVLSAIRLVDNVTNIEELRHCYSKLLAAIGTYSMADRAYIFSCPSLEKPILKMTGAWCREGMAPIVDLIQSLTMDDMPSFGKRLWQGKPVISTSWEKEWDLYPKEHEILKGQGIHSLIVIPIQCQGRFNGYIGLDNPGLVMTELVVKILTSVGRYLGRVKDNLLMLQKLEKKQDSLETTIQELHQEKQYMEALSIDYTSVYVCDLVADTMDTLKCNEKTNTVVAEKKLTKGIHCYSYRVQYYYDHYIVQESAPDFMEKMSAPFLISYLSKHKRFAYRFQTVPNPAGQQYFEVQMVRIPSPEGFKVIMGYRYIDDLIAEHEKQQLTMQKALAEAQFNSEVVGTISKFYWIIYRMNLLDGTYEEISAGEEVHRLTGKHGNTEEVFREVRDTVVAKEHKMRMETFMDTSTLADRLEHVESVAMEYQAKDGSWHLARFVCKKRNAEGRAIHVLYIVRKIDRQKEKEAKYKQKLRDIAEEATKANMAKTDFLRRMSHDIRTPINGIQGMLAMADHFPEDMEKQKECREKLKDASRFLLDLVNHVLDMNKLESGAVVLSHVPFDMRDVLTDTEDIIAVQAKEAAISFTVEEEGMFHHSLVGSPLHLRQILQNIAGNAVKYTSSGGDVVLSVREETCKEGKAYYTILCKDNGRGMSPSFLKRAFEPFAQEDVDARSKYTGTGLGLPIVKELVKLMGGTIYIESHKHVGTTVTIHLPFDIQDKEVEAKKALPAPPMICLTGKRVLLVEDNELNMEISTFFLENRGMVVTKAWNGKEAVEIFQQSLPGTFDLILMDVMMPVMDGLAATRCIRALEHKDAKRIPILAMSANAFQEDIQSSLAAGMNGHLSKPINEKALYRVISDCLKHSMM